MASWLNNFWFMFYTNGCLLDCARSPLIYFEIKRGKETFFGTTAGKNSLTRPPSGWEILSFWGENVRNSGKCGKWRENLHFSSPGSWEINSFFLACFGTAMLSYPSSHPPPLIDLVVFCTLHNQAKGWWYNLLHWLSWSTELFHMTSAKSGGGKTRATSLHVMFSTVWSLNSRSVVWLSTAVV